MYQVTVIRYSVNPLFTAEFAKHAGAQAVALLQQLVQQQYDQACNA
jgi:hypothetical protein